MHPLTKFASKLYPRWWRERYGDEFAALLEDARPGISGTLDVLKGALTMQFTSTSSVKMLLLCSLCGLIVALSTTLFLTPKYSSSAVINIHPPQVAGSTQIDIVDRINELSNKVLSRTELMTLMRNLGLYREERQRMPLEDVLEQMKSDIRISASPAIVGGRSVPAFELSFTYRDPAVASKVVNTLVGQFLYVNLETAQAQTQSSGTTLEVLDPASKPERPVFPNRTAIAFAGLGGGVLVGGMFILMLQFRRRLQPAGGALAELPEDAPAGAGVVRPGAWSWKPLIFGAAVGTLAGLVAAYCLTSVYASNAVLSMEPREGMTRLSELSAQAFSRQELSDLIRSQNLYAGERAKMTTEEVLTQMRQNIRITAVPAKAGDSGIPAFALRFTYADRFTAQKVATSLVSKLLNANLKLASARPEQAATLKILDPASLPQTPIFPNRPATTLAGLAAGTALGALVAFIRRMRRA